MASLQQLVSIMKTLRDPVAGCPWDRAQTFSTIVPHTLEEAYEVADTIESGRLAALPDELGDLLFQVIFYSQLGAEQQAFTIDDVIAGICSKLTSRHPHVFGNVVTGSASEQQLSWENIKAEERRSDGDGNVSELDGIALTLPALSRAAKLQKRAARVGFDWPEVDGALAKVEEEFDELAEAVSGGEPLLRIEEELGDVLFAVVNVARKLGVDPEAALRSTNRKFERRFRHVETRLAESGETPAGSDLARMDELWDEAKALEKKNGHLIEAPVIDQREERNSQSRPVAPPT